METSVFIARIFGLCYLIIGAGFIFNRKAFQQVVYDFCKNAALVFYGGLLALVIGVVILLTIGSVFVLLTMVETLSA